MTVSSIAILVALGCQGQVMDEDRAAEPGDPSDPNRPSRMDPDAPSPWEPPVIVPPDGYRGVMDCPTVELPSYTQAAQLAGRSPAFRQVCGSCHGDTGRGEGTAPDLTEIASLDQYIAAVREGRYDQGMPSFDASVISDDELRMDFEALRAGNAAELVESGVTHPFDWTDEEVEARYRAGLQAFRTPDSEGAACANCHAPDGIDLAILSYSDADLRRRGLLHLDSPTVEQIVDLIHAQRRRFDIAETCDADGWRPMQPGGTPLEGDTDPELELAFAQQFMELAPFTASGDVLDRESAQSVLNEWRAINPRRVRLGVKYPYWTRDRFHGANHASMNEWISMVPHLPKDGWYARMDAYLTDPSDRNMVDILHRYKAETDLGMNVDRSTRGGRHIHRQYGTMMSLQHVIRQELSGEGGLFDGGPDPFEGYYQPTNDYQGPNGFWLVGNATGGLGVGACREMAPEQVLGCFGFPNVHTEEWRASGESIEDYWTSMHHSWFMMNFTWEPAGVGRLEARGFKYWKLERTFETFFVHTTRIVLATLMPEQVSFRWFRSGHADDVPPMLDGNWMADWFGNPETARHIRARFEDDPSSQAAYEIYRRVAANTFLALAYAYGDALAERNEVSNGERIVQQLETWRDFVRTHGPTPTAADSLFDDLITRTQAAPNLYSYKEAYGPYCDRDTSPVGCTGNLHPHGYIYRDE